MKFRNNNTVVVGGHPNPTYHRSAVILLAAGSRMVSLKRRKMNGGYRETHNRNDRDAKWDREKNKKGTEKYTRGKGGEMYNFDT